MAVEEPHDMRSGTIIIGGKPYPVKGLTVRQSLTEGQKAVEDKAVSTKIEGRMRAVAIALQNADAFIPDPSNPSGLFKASDKTTDEVVVALNADIFDSMDEWYAAETAVAGLNYKLPETSAGPVAQEVTEGSAGEPQATA